MHKTHTQKTDLKKLQILKIWGKLHLVEFVENTPLVLSGKILQILKQ